MNKLELTSKIYKFLSKAFGFMGLVVIISALALSVPTALADFKTSGPDWNTGTTANEQNWFQVADETQGTGFQDSVNAKAGDVLKFRIYVHNNTCPANDANGNNHDQCPLTAATHVFVKSTLPQTGGTVTAMIGSDNSAAVSKSVTVTLPSSQTVTYKVGSTTYTRHPFMNAWVDLTRDVTYVGDNDITTSGQSLGDISGCYSQSVFVVYEATVTNNQPTPTPTPTPSPAPAPAPAVLGTQTLPNTGPENGVQLLLAGLVPAGLILRRLKL